MEHVENIEVNTYTESLVADIRGCLLDHQDDWWIIKRDMPELSQQWLAAFANGWKSARNPTLTTIIRMEKAAKLVDPAFLSTEENG